MPVIIYVKQVDDKTYCLVDKDGNNINLEGRPTYHPFLYAGKAENSGFPVYEEKK